MKKIPSLFTRTADGRSLTREYHALASWVVNGEGVATRKWDGTAVRCFDGKLWARYDAKRGKPLPVGFMPCQDPDPITGHHPGWVPASRAEDKWIREAAAGTSWQDGTYEACGPRIGGNPERLSCHMLIRHGAAVLVDAPRDHAGLLTYFANHDIEGIVWWRDLENVDCDKVKITGSALGIERHRPTRPRGQYDDEMALSEMCLELHNGNTRSYIDAARRIALMDFIQWKLNHWKAPHPRWQEFDDAVRTLCEVTLQECASTRVDGVG